MKKMKLLVNRINLQVKMWLICVLTVLIVGLSAFFSIGFLQHHNNKLLYRSIADSMSKSTADIESSLNNIKALSGLIITDAKLQQQLDLYNRKRSPYEKNEVSTDMKNILITYLNQYNNTNIDSIHLDVDGRTITTFLNHLDSAPAEVMEPIFSTAKEMRGGALWVTDYAREYGIILTRSVRKLNMLDLSHMGYITIFIDFQKMIENATNLNENASETFYLIFNQDHEIIYCPDSVPAEEAKRIRTNASSPYQITNIDGKKFFTVKDALHINGSNTTYNWDYYCLMPYNDIYKSVFTVYICCIFFLLAAIFLAAVLSNSLIRNITCHFDYLIQKMNKFRNSDMALLELDYDYKKRKDEIGMIHNTFDNMATEIRNLVNVNYINELLKKEAQLKALEHQINPHFLYNTLESVNWRAKDIGADDISAMVESLAALLRKTLSDKDKHFTIRKELEIVTSYLTIQKIRFEERLEYKVAIAPEYLDVEILKLTIEPLVENAIQYGLERNRGVCHILIEACRDEDVLYLYVKNNGSEFEEGLLRKLQDASTSPRGLGIGLLNIHKRLQLAFGENFGLSLYNEDELAVARIAIPYLSKKEN